MEPPTTERKPSASAADGVGSPRRFATAWALEQSTLGLAAGTFWALQLAIATRPAALLLARPALIVAAALAAVGCLAQAVLPAASLWQSEVTRSGWGARAALRQRVVASLGVALAAALAVAAFVAPVYGEADKPPTRLDDLPLAAMAVPALLATLWLGLAALRAGGDDGGPGRAMVSANPIATLAQPTGQALLGGMALMLLVGMVIGRITAELTYELAAGVSMAALWASGSAGRVLRGLHQLRAREQRAGLRRPGLDAALRLAVMATLLGVLLPAVVIVGELARARVAGVIIAAFALVASGHPLRYGLSLALWHGRDTSHLYGAAGDSSGATADAFDTAG